MVRIMEEVNTRWQFFLSLFKLRYLQSCTFQSPFPHLNDGKMARFALRENSSMTLGGGGYNFFFVVVVVVVFLLFCSRL